MLTDEPIAQFRHRQVRMRLDMGEDCLAVWVQAQRHMTSLRARGGLTGAATPQIGLVDERDAHLEALGNLAGWFARIECRHDLVAKILRIRPPGPPAHRTLRSMPETCESHHPPAPEEPIARSPSIGGTETFALVGLTQPPNSGTAATRPFRR